MFSWQLLLSGFMLGTVSSFHCVGMCGPIALALPVHYLSGARKLTGVLLYHTGRIFIYAALGLFFGWLGRQFFLAGWQQYFSIFLGILLLLALVATLLPRNLLHLRFVDLFQKKLQSLMGFYIRQKQLYGMFILGMANGLLPCGMVYLAVTGAMAAGSVPGGITFMMAFGLGTFPAMVLLTYFGAFIGLTIRNRMKKAIPVFIALMGILLILRGLNLNIPMVSPLLKNSAEHIVNCP